MAALCDIASWSLLVKLTQPWRTEKLFPELCQAGHLECQWVWWLFFFHLPPRKETEANLSVCMFCVAVTLTHHSSTSCSAEAPRTAKGDEGRRRQLHLLENET